MGTNVPFSASDLCLIIDACHKNCVSSLKLGTLHVEFSQVPPLRGNVPVGANQFSSGETLDDTSEDQFAVAPDMTTPKAELTDEDRVLLEEARLAQLVTDDPLAYETEMIDALQN